MVILIFGSFGGFLFQMMEGIHVKKWFCVEEFKVNPAFKVVKIPPLVGMIIFGCIARNFFGDFVKDAYPVKWTGWMKYICHCILLIRAGL
mmetsp:Transcript_8502/g.7857  ORF Transcript_8502/g.7857 Transcript_8502/m.7857 type:complete len:90 (+) Transcript_8502:108-377(+)